MADAEKKTKREKLLEKEEKKREKRIMKEKSKQYDGGFTARCVALLLGFVLGVAGTIGGAAGAGYSLFRINPSRKSPASRAEINSTSTNTFPPNIPKKRCCNFSKISAPLLRN